MPREITLFTDDGRWAAVVTAWDAPYVIYRSLGVRVRVYRLGVPDSWGSARGPWGRFGPWLRGPWSARGPWGAWGPWRADGPWALGPWRAGPWRDAGHGGPWGTVLAPRWVESPAERIEIKNHYLGPEGKGEVTTEKAADRVAFLRLEESGFGLELQRRDAGDHPVRIESVRSEVRVVVDRAPLAGQVSTGP